MSGTMDDESLVESFGSILENATRKNELNDYVTLNKHLMITNINGLESIKTGKS